MELRPDAHHHQNTVVTIENSVESSVMIFAVIARKVVMLSMLTPSFGRRSQYIKNIFDGMAQGYPHDVTFRDKDLREIHSKLNPLESPLSVSYEIDQTYSETIHSTARTIADYFNNRA